MKITPAHAGVWVSDQNGRFASAVLVEIALNFPGFLKGKTALDTKRNRREARELAKAFHADHEGVLSMKIYPRFGPPLDYEITSDVFEAVAGQGGVADDAEDYLNSIAPEGYSFGWHDGDFFMQSGEWWDEEAA